MLEPIVVVVHASIEGAAVVRSVVSNLSTATLDDHCYITTVFRSNLSVFTSFFGLQYIVHDVSVLLSLLDAIEIFLV